MKQLLSWSTFLLCIVVTAVQTTQATADVIQGLRYKRVLQQGNATSASNGTAAVNKTIEKSNVTKIAEREIKENKSSEEEEVDESKVLHFHIVAHSHDDVGWLMTPTSYYATYVKEIITNVVQALMKNPKRKFSQTEIYYFERWWGEQNETVRDNVRGLIKNGQLEFVNGGWAASDEACPTYQEIITNIMVGHAFLERTFGIPPPKHAWHLDSFGHSAVTPELFSRMGFETITFARLNIAERTQRKKDKEFQFIWKGKYSGLSQERDSKYSIFANFLYEHYDAPCEMDLSYQYQSESALSQNYDYLLRSRKQEPEILFKCILNYAAPFKTNHIMIPFGNDFSFRYAELSYNFMDRLMEFVANYTKYNKTIKFQYSTVDEYFHALNKSATQISNFQWPEHRGDFFPYQGVYVGTYWTGFYTSRSNFKKLIRDFTSAAQSLETLVALDTLRKSKTKKDFSRSRINTYPQKVGELTHHDSITGTSMKSVVDSGSYIIQSNTSSAMQLSSDYLKDLIQWDLGITLDQVDPCVQLIHQRKICPDPILSKTKNLLWLVYNPASETQDLASLMFPTANVSISRVINKTHEAPVETEAHCSLTPDLVQECEIFAKVEVSPLSYQLFSVRNLINNSTASTVQPHGVSKINEVESPVVFTSQDAILLGKQASLYELLVKMTPQPIQGATDCNNSQYYISNSHLSLQLLSCSQDKLVFNVQKSGKHGPLHLEFDLRYYSSYLEEEDQDQERPGLAILNLGKAKDSTPIGINVTHISTSHSLFMNQTIIYFTHQNRLGQAKQGSLRVLLHEDSELLEADLDLQDLDPPYKEMGKKVLSRDLTANWKVPELYQGEVFYSDQNAFSFVKRNTTTQKEEQLSSSFYPVNSAIYIEDPKSLEQFGVAVDQQMSGSAHQLGRIELIILRQGNSTDGISADEPISDETAAAGFNLSLNFKLVFGNKNQTNHMQDMLFRADSRRMNKPFLFLSDYFPKKSSEPSSIDFAQKTKDITKFEAFTRTFGIIDMHFIPYLPVEPDKFLVRVSRFDPENDVGQGRVLTKELLLQQICNYIDSLLCEVFTIKEVLLNGDTTREPRRIRSSNSLILTMYEISVHSQSQP